MKWELKLKRNGKMKHKSDCNCNRVIFTALHAMQTRSSDENSVRLSVRPSHA